MDSSQINSNCKNASRQQRIPVFHSLDGVGESRVDSGFSKSEYCSGRKCDPAKFRSGLNDLALFSKYSTKMALAQRKGIDTLAKWAKDSRNSAIDDVMQNTSQLIQMFTEKQLEFAQRYEYFIRRLGGIAETDLRLESYVANVKRLEEEEKKLKRTTKRGPFFTSRSPEEKFYLEQKLAKVSAQREISQRQLDEARDEAEIVKMIHFREAIIGISDAYRNLATSSQAIFSCQREIAEFVPAVSTQDISKMMYDGKPFTRERVEEVRRSLEIFELSSQREIPVMRRNQSEPSGRFARSMAAVDIQPLHDFNEKNPYLTQGTPPPPYMSPSAPHIDALDLPPATPRLRFRLRNQKRQKSEVQFASNSSEYGNNNLPPSERIYPDLSPNPYAKLKQFSTNK